MQATFQNALDEARTELQIVEKKLDELLPRKDKLTRLIKSLEALTPPALELPLEPEEEAPAELPQEREALWQAISRLMAGKPSFTLTEAGAAVEAETGISLNPFRPQKVRNAITRHLETFRANEDGTYTVVKGDV